MSGSRDSAPPPIMKPGDNPALDAAIARMRANVEHVGAPEPENGRGAEGAGAGATAAKPDTMPVDAAQPGAPAEMPRRRRKARGAVWWVVGLPAVTIGGAVAVMAMAVIGSMKREPEAAGVGPEDR